MADTESREMMGDNNAKTMPPSVTIIMPCHNAARHLPTSIGSVMAQTCPNWELIAVNDGSSDDTLSWLAAHPDPRLHLQSQPNLGVSVARNAGLAAAAAKYIAFLDADDTWTPRFLERMIAALDAAPDAVLAYCGWQNLGLSDARGEPFVPPDYENSDKTETLFAGCRWPIHAALVRREAVVAAGGFNPALKNAEDYALWLRIAIDAPLVRVPEVLAYYHFHDGVQASANKARAALHHFHAQQDFLRERPDVRSALGLTRSRRLTLGELLKRGYRAYWARDLAAARAIFRKVMRKGYGKPLDWKYMLPALLPEPWHHWLIRKFGK